MAITIKGEDPRGPASLIGKVVNSQTRQAYKREYPFCEFCKLEGYYNTKHIDTHHIIPGLGRTDEWWNYLSACRFKHHNQCTTHINGRKAVAMNFLAFAYKFVKGEITEAKLIEIGQHEYVMPLVPEMRVIYNNAYGIKS